MTGDQDHLAELAAAIAGSRADPELLKKEFSKRYGWGTIPTNPTIIAHAPAEVREAVSRVLRKKPSRTISGVAPVAVMTSPAPCPHGTCSFCPGGTESGTPQSYTGREPAAMRAAQHDFDPGRQVAARLAQYRAGGHPTDKVDLIIMGGTFTARSRDYQGSFVKGCLDALNGSISPDLTAAQDANASASNRCIGLTVETRPDMFTGARVQDALDLGATRVELGVQTLRDDILTSVGRGHTVTDSVRATSDARKAGLKVLYQMMPGLPGSTPESDLEDFRRLFVDPALRPDMIKIYPTLVIEGTPLYDMWAAGDYEPLDDDAAVDLLAQIKRLVPPWVRIQRVQRDIPAPLISAGVRKGNLREIVQRRMSAEGASCRCIRCREVGRVVPNGDGTHDLTRREYGAAGGREIFLSFENEATIAAYLRLRITADGKARIRELKVLGELVPIGRSDHGWQHRGMGTALLEEAESIAADGDVDTVLVTSGVGARDYYVRRGYALEGMYMVKRS